MKAPIRFLALLIAIVVVAVAACFATLTLLTRDSNHNVDSHEWLHRELNLTPEEDAALKVIEQKYLLEHSHLEKEMKAAQAHLALILSEEDKHSERVTDAVHEIHRIHGNIQDLSIQHFFEMQTVLPQEKNAKLRQLAAEALSEPQ